MAELTFKLQCIELITTISSPFHKDWPIIQKSYLWPSLLKRLTSSQSSFLRCIVSKQKFSLTKILLPLSFFAFLSTSFFCLKDKSLQTIVLGLLLLVFPFERCALLMFMFSRPSFSLKIFWISSLHCSQVPPFFFQ